MTRIFISYRRSDDAGSVGRVRDRLRDAYGDNAVFRDIDGIPRGTRFSEVISAELDSCEVLLVVIGPHWLDATNDKGGRRLEDPEDWVRTEVELGLARTDLRLLPVLVGGAALPKPAQLPESLRGLLAWNAAFLEDDSFDHDFAALVEDLGGRRGLLRHAPALAAAIIVVALASALALFRVDDTPDEPVDVAASPSVTVLPPPEEMDGVFNIAVAGFTSTDPDNQDEAEQLAASLSTDLERAMVDDPDIQIRGPADVGPLAGDTRDACHESAEAVAQEIGADVVVGGQVDFSDPTTITGEALIRDTRLAYNPELAGYFDLADDISYPGSFTNAVTERELIKQLEVATGSLAQFMRGVAYYSLVDAAPENHDIAKAAFEAALASENLPVANQEAAHAFLGSLALLRRDLPAATARFEQAVALNEGSARARLGLAEVRLQQSNGEGCVVGSVDGDGLSAAAAAFAAVTPRETDPPSTAIKARLGQARARRCLSQAGLSDDFGQVTTMLEQVVADGGDAPALRELVAAAHAELALTLAPAAGGTPDRAAVEAALAETEQAIATTQRLQNKAVFQWQAAFYLRQLGRTEEATAMLAEATESDPTFDPVTVSDLTAQPAGRLVPRGNPGSFAVAGYVLAYTGRGLVELFALALALLVLGGALVTTSNQRRLAQG